MASATMEIVTTRDIARQILRHRSFSFQEFSQRYASVNDIGSGLEFAIREARLQDTSNRQNSIPIEEQDIENRYMALQWERKQKELPEGLTQSRLYMAGTIRSWIHYIELRSANGTQLEHQRIAKECARELAKIVPLFNKTENS